MWCVCSQHAKALHAGSELTAAECSDRKKREALLHLRVAFNSCCDGTNFCHDIAAIPVRIRRASGEAHA